MSAQALGIENSSLQKSDNIFAEIDRVSKKKIPFLQQKHFVVEVSYANNAFRILNGANNKEALIESAKKNASKSKFDMVLVDHNTVTCIPRSKTFDPEKLMQKTKRLQEKPSLDYAKQLTDFKEYKEKKLASKRTVYNPKDEKDIDELKNQLMSANQQQQQSPTKEESIPTMEETYDFKLQNMFHYACVSFVEDDSEEMEHAFAIYGIFRSYEDGYSYMIDAARKKIQHSDLFIVRTNEWIRIEDSFNRNPMNDETCEWTYRHKMLNELKDSLTQDDDIDDDMIAENIMIKDEETEAEAEGELKSTSEE